VPNEPYRLSHDPHTKGRTTRAHDGQLRGFHNPNPGAFFVFEIVSAPGGAPPSTVTILRGDLVFGHFTEATGDGRLVSNTRGLAIELIAWDPAKGSAGYRKVLAARGMQERLRPLFCPVEVNVESDAGPFDDRKPAVSVPSGFFVDARLATADVSVARQAYDAALGKLRSRLPDATGRVDADHAWLTPTKADSDIAAVDALIELGVISREFAADVRQ
jgi:hypothetical protein